MQLGNFSVSLAVKDLQRSISFYAKLGFEQVHGEESQGWIILRNDNCIIGLFQGMFDRNILTFNPGWNSDSEKLESFTDVREIQKQLREEGIAFAVEADEQTTGPASFVIEDPDGNQILVDQHV